MLIVDSGLRIFDPGWKNLICDVLLIVCFDPENFLNFWSGLGFFDIRCIVDCLSGVWEFLIRTGKIWYSMYCHMSQSLRDHAQLRAVQRVQRLPVHHVHLREPTVRHHALDVAIPIWWQLGGGLRAGHRVFRWSLSLYLLLRNTAHDFYLCRIGLIKLNISSYFFIPSANLISDRRPCSLISAIRCVL